MQKVHFLGIGGSGASAVAAIAQSYGFEVTGCDINPFNEFTTVFDKAQLLKGHSTLHIQNLNPGILTVTPAVFSLDPDNEEILYAKRIGLPVLTWQEFMGKYLEHGKFVIAIAGTHGKSTITAMVGFLLEEAKLDPTVELGAIAPRWKTNYRIGKDKYFVTEADEFNDNFLVSQPNITIVTSIEFDHPEYFKDFSSYKESFKRFLKQTKQTIIANLSDRGVAEVLANQDDFLNAKIIDYSTHPIDFPLKIPGDFNKLNASAVYQLGRMLRIDHDVIKSSLSGYTGLGRRFEYLGEFKATKVYSDFAHHPTEIKVNIEAARKLFMDKKLWVIFQPHMFSRTKALFDDFVKVFKGAPADQILIMDIYPSREIDTGLVNSKQLVEAIDNLKVRYLPKDEDIEKYLKGKSGSYDVLLFLGAGDIDKSARSLVKHDRF